MLGSEDNHQSRVRIDADHYEASPSTDWRETAEILHAPHAHDIEESPDNETPREEYQTMLSEDSLPPEEVAT